MLQTELIMDFLNSKVIAVVGVSRKGDIPANHIFRKFRDSGYKTFPINPNTTEIEGTTCYPDLGSLPENADAVVLASTPDVSEQMVEEVHSLGASIVWMHHGMGTGSYSSEAEKKYLERGVKVINNGCPMMFLSPVDGFHKVFRWFKKF